MTNTAITIPTEELAKESRSEKQLLEAMRQLYEQMDSPDIYQAAMMDQKAVLERIAKKNSERQYLKEPALESCRRVDAAFKPHIELLTHIKDELNIWCARYRKAEEDKRRLLEANLRESAEAERKRLQQEAQKKLDAGQADSHKELMDQARSVPVPIVPSSVPAVQGMAKFTTWDFKPVWDDGEVQTGIPMKAIRGGVEGKIPRHLFCIDAAKMRSLAGQLKELFDFPGFRAFSIEKSRRTGR